MVTKKAAPPARPNFMPLIYYTQSDYQYYFDMAARGEFSFFFPVTRRTIQEKVGLPGIARPWVERFVKDTEFMMLDIHVCPELVDWYIDGCPGIIVQPEPIEFRFIAPSSREAKFKRADGDLMRHPPMPNRLMLFIDPANRNERNPGRTTALPTAQEAQLPAAPAPMPAAPPPEPPAPIQEPTAAPAPEPDTESPNYPIFTPAPMPAAEPPPAPAPPPPPPVEDESNGIVFGVK